jgi:hypothetical protein
VGGRIRGVPRRWGIDPFAFGYRGDLFDRPAGERVKVIASNWEAGDFEMGRTAKLTARVAMLFVVMISAAHGQQSPLTTGELSAPVDRRPQNTSEAPAGGQVKAQPAKPVQHRFWDRENILLFSAVGIGRGLDYASTLNIRRRGINEIFLTNGIVDNHPLFASIEAGGTAASIGVSYIFHRTGHHALERWTSIVHFGVAVGGAARNYALKTPHPN